jgi:hypothetical protein
MNSIILCEGRTDAVLIGKYLEANKQWKYSRKDKQGLALNKEDNNQIIDKYQRNEDWVYIWGVGGRTRFESPLQKIFTINQLDSTLGFNNIVVIVDNDDEENDMIQEIAALLRISGLKGDEWNDIPYTDRFDQRSIVKLMIMIIPFEEKGALETVLINGIVENDDENIVDQCCYFVDNIKTTRCLRKRREVLKAKLSAIISIFYPDRAVDSLVEIFTGIDWTKSKAVNQAFMKLLEL